MGNFTHMKRDGSTRMVDVSGKEKTYRRAIAAGRVSVSGRVVKILKSGTLPKGNLIETARIAGVMGAKRTSELIPLCHQIPLDLCEVNVDIDEDKNDIHIRSEVAARWSTGVEMEALVAASIAALTIYDMIKAVDRGACIHDIKVLSKSGGTSGDYVRESDK